LACAASAARTDSVNDQVRAIAAERAMQVSEESRMIITSRHALHSSALMTAKWQPRSTPPCRR
jgi:hypothetical protein